MKALYVLSILISAAIVPTAARSQKENDRIWDKLSAVFGGHLQSSFGDSSIFHYASSTDPPSLTQNGYRVLCTNYTHGQIIGIQKIDVVASVCYNNKLIHINIILQSTVLSVDQIYR